MFWFWCTYIIICIKNASSSYITFERHFYVRDTFYRNICRKKFELQFGNTTNSNYFVDGSEKTSFLQIITARWYLVLRSTWISIVFEFQMWIGFLRQMYPSGKSLWSVVKSTRTKTHAHTHTHTHVVGVYMRANW